MKNLHLSQAAALAGPLSGDDALRHGNRTPASTLRMGNEQTGDRTMTTMNKTKGVIAIAGLLVGLAFAGFPALAQTSPPVPTPDPGNGMMRRGTPNGEAMMPGMMDPKMQEQMSRMMDNCNRMMESMMPNKDGGTRPSVPNKG